MTADVESTATAESFCDLENLDVVIVGAGFAGMYMLYRVRELGLSVRVFEDAPEVGGTWYWNRYPGARCDTESFYYSYSFSEELQQEWGLDERYPSQPRNLEYLSHVADRFGLRADIEFDTKVTSATWDDDRARWIVTTSGGRRVASRFMVTAVGCLSSTNKPHFYGLDEYGGAIYYTSEWPHDDVDLTDKRVGVIGTGSTGIQVIPEIAKRAGHVTVFQRTPQYALPANNHVLDADLVAQVKARYDEVRAQCRDSPAGVPFEPAEHAALEVEEDARRVAFERAWKRGGGRLLGAFNDILRDADANEAAAEFVREKIREIVEDPEVAEALIPTTYPIGTKRIPLDNGYYASFNRDNVELVDLRRTPITQFTNAGIETSEREILLDVVVFATGFDAITGSILAMNLEGRSSLTMQSKWSDGPRTYLGLSVAGFPNLFTITGPGSPSVLTNMPMSIEQHVDWITACLSHMLSEGAETIEATAEAERKWTEHVGEVAAGTLYPRAPSWYVGANISGKPKAFMPYVGGLAQYRRICARIAAQGYVGFAVDQDERGDIDSLKFDVAEDETVGVPET